MDGDCHRVGDGGDGRCVYGDRLRGRRPPEPGRDPSGRDTFGGFQQSRPVHSGADGGSHGGRVPGVAALPAPLEGDARGGLEARLLLHGSGDLESDGEPVERDHRHVRAGVSGGGGFFPNRGGGRNGGGGGGAPPGAAGLGPYLVGSLVWGIGLSLGGTTGYAINPARDLGPRIAHAILPIANKEGSDWGYAAIPIVGPLLGGSLAGLLVRAIHF